METRLSIAQIILLGNQETLRGKKAKVSTGFLKPFADIVGGIRCFLLTHMVPLVLMATMAQVSLYYKEIVSLTIHARVIYYDT